MVLSSSILKFQRVQVGANAKDGDGQEQCQQLTFLREQLKS